MAPKWNTVGNGFLQGISTIPDIDPSKLTITLAPKLKDVPEPSEVKFGSCMTDHMLVISFDPETGWGAPEIKPYAPIQLDPASSCLQYSTNIFEGMKAYMGPDSEPRLFRPELNMARFNTSAARVALPPFSPNGLLTLIKQLVHLEKRWIPPAPYHALYIRPTMLGTRAALGVAASDHAMIYVICCPAGPYFPNPRPIRLLAVSEVVRSWPGGTGGYKLGLNYSPGFTSLRSAGLDGFDQILWLLPSEGGKEMRITEAGAMNFFVVVERDDGDDGWDVITPPLDGTILPGITRSSALELLTTHSNTGLVPPLGHIPSTKKIRVFERNLTMGDVSAWAKNGKLLEAFGVGTAVLVVAVGEIGVEGKDKLVTDTVMLPTYPKVLGPVGAALHDRLFEIQEGRAEFKDWSVVCD